MGLSWHATSVKVLTIVTSATQSASLPPMTEGKKIVSVFCIIG